MVGDHGYCIGEIQAANGAGRWDAESTEALDPIPRQTTGFAAKDQHQFFSDRHRGVGLGTASRQTGHWPLSDPLQEALTVAVLLKLDVLPVVDSSPPNGLLTCRKAQWMHQVKVRTNANTQSPDVPSVPRNLGGDQGDVQTPQAQASGSESACSSFASGSGTGGAV